MYDAVVITGLPRSGTSFLVRLFGVTITPPYDGIASYGHTDEPHSIGHMLQNGETRQKVWQNLCNYLTRIKTENKLETVVYKHPQLIFFYPEEANIISILHVICNRNNYKRWVSSMVRHGLTLGDNNTSWLRDIWPGSKAPENIDERLDIYYKATQDKIKSVRDSTDHVYFLHENPLSGLQELLQRLEIQEDAQEIIDKNWRVHE